MEEKEKKLSLSFWLVLLAAAGMYALLAMNHNIWADEAYTFAMLRHGFADICRITAVDSHPPLYYLAAKLFTMPFDYSEYAVRLFSSACSLLVVGIGGWQLTKLFNRKVGLLFMVLYALFPFILERSMETRMYPLAALGIFLCALFAYRAWQDNKARHWVGFVCGGLCAAYSHYFALAAAGILYGLLFLCILFKKRQLLKSWLIAALVTIALYAPWLGSLIGQLAYKVDHEYWIAPITPATLIDYAKGLFQATGFSFFYLFFQCTDPVPKTVLRTLHLRFAKLDQCYFQKHSFLCCVFELICQLGKNTDIPEQHPGFDHLCFLFQLCQIFC